MTVTPERIEEIRRLFNEKRDGRIVGDLLEYADMLRASISRYEGMITWGTSCSNCASLLDSSYMETTLREEAEAKVSRVEALWADNAVKGEAGGSGGGCYITPDELRAALDNKTLSTWQVQRGDGPWLVVESWDAALRLKEGRPDIRIRKSRSTDATT